MNVQNVVIACLVLMVQILLIVSILSIVELKKFLDLAHDLGLSAIVETHDGNEIRTAMNVGAEIIGVNNRNLQDFSVDIDNSISLRRCVSDNILFISESGIKTKEDVTRLKENDVDLSKEPKTVNAELFRANDIENYDTCKVDMTFENGAKALYIASHATDTVCEPMFEYYFENLAKQLKI